MGRPRLYFTPEEQRLANQEKSRKSYHKHKNSIKTRRMERWREEHPKKAGPCSESPRRAGRNGPVCQESAPVEEGWTLKRDSNCISPPPRNSPDGEKIIVESSSGPTDAASHQPLPRYIGLGHWLGRSDRLSRKFKKTVNDSPRAHLESLAQQYMQSGRKDVILTAILEMERLRKHGERYEAELFSRIGMETYTQAVADLNANISKVISAMEDLLCTAIADPAGFRSKHLAGRFIYQTSF